MSVETTPSGEMVAIQIAGTEVKRLTQTRGNGSKECDREESSVREKQRLERRKQCKKYTAGGKGK